MIRAGQRRAELLLDERCLGQAPVRELPVLHWIGVWCRTPVKRDRFIPAEEEATMLRLERELMEIARRVSNGWAVHVMRIVSEGLVEYYFYARAAETLGGVAAELQRSFPEYRIEQDAKPDAEWEEYRRHRAKGG